MKNTHQSETIQLEYVPDKTIMYLDPDQIERVLNEHGTNPSKTTKNLLCEIGYYLSDNDVIFQNIYKAGKFNRIFQVRDALIAMTLEENSNPAISEIVELLNMHLKDKAIDGNVIQNRTQVFNITDGQHQKPIKGRILKDSWTGTHGSIKEAA